MANNVISTEELANNLDSYKVLDCSVTMGRQPGDDHRVNFLKSHIKGAQFLDLDNLKDQRSDLPFMMPSDKQFADAMKRLNVRLSDKVVCYDTGAMQFFGFRAAWMFQAMGHDNVWVLDGGFPKWTAEGRPVEGDANGPSEGFEYKLNPDRIKLLEQMKAFAGNAAERNYQLLDVRAPD